METNSPSEAELIIQKVPSDTGIHRNPRKGTLGAPKAVMEEFEFDQDVMIDEVFPDEFSLENTQERIEKNTGDLASYSKPVISIGGDHSISFPAIKALKDENPGMKLVWLDAHLDVKEPVDSHTSHDVVIRELIEKGIFREEDIWIVGVTRIDDDEKEFLEEHNLKTFGPSETGKFIREFDPGEQSVYLSVDIDALDKITGTGYPDGELPIATVKELIAKIGPRYADIVEVAPSLDEGKTVKKAQKILGRLAESCPEASK